jgi:hypothetical protein
MKAGHGTAPPFGGAQDRHFRDAVCACGRAGDFAHHEDHLTHLRLAPKLVKLFSVQSYRGQQLFSKRDEVLPPPGGQLPGRFF